MGPNSFVPSVLHTVAPDLTVIDPQMVNSPNTTRCASLGISIVPKNVPAEPSRQRTSPEAIVGIVTRGPGATQGLLYKLEAFEHK